MTTTDFWNDPSTVLWLKNRPATKYLQEFFTSLDKKKFPKVLDLGCGAGRNSQMLAALGFEVYACDFEPTMVNETRSRLKGVLSGLSLEDRVIEASMFNLPYPSDNFDAIVSNGVYHYASSVEELDLALSESTRVLRKAGVISFNLFSSKYIAPELTPVSGKMGAYVTPQNLDVILISPDEFLAIARHNRLDLAGRLTEYEQEWTTGKKSVMRGILIKE